MLIIKLLDCVVSQFKINSLSVFLPPFLINCDCKKLQNGAVFSLQSNFCLRIVFLYFEKMSGIIARDSMTFK